MSVRETLSPFDETRSRPARPVRPRQPRPGPRGRLLPAGEIFVIGLLCFGLWLLVDARQLDNSAHAQPLGVRRSVAIAILSPIARINEAFGLDRVVNTLNRLLSRNASTPGGVADTAPPPTRFPATAASASAVVPFRRGVVGDRFLGRGPSQFDTPTTPSIAFPADLAQPSVSRPLSVLDIGDSIGEDLGNGLGDVIGPTKSVQLALDSVGDTGLSNFAYYNWPQALASELHELRPALVVALFGGNDWQSFLFHNTVAEPGSPQWIAGYRARVAQIMSETRAAGAQMVWVGLPIMGPDSMLPPKTAPTLNTVFEQEAARYGVAYYSPYKLFENAKGQYSEYLPDPSGSIVQVRDADGVHLAPPAGEDLLATKVVALIESRWKIKV